jgi:putative intracellular protease/amidase
MQRGLEGRRIAMYADAQSSDRVGVVVKALEQAGARVHELRNSSDDEEWHGAKYAALIAVGTARDEFSKPPRLQQLIREFLVSEKPIAAYGAAVSAIVEAGGAEGRTLAGQGTSEAIHADGPLVTAQGAADLASFSGRVVREFAEQLEEREMDTMVDQSFPASDPPSTSPASIGPVAPDGDRDARP